MSKLIFIGERPSNRALQLGVSLKDGRLAAKPLFEALRACGIEPTEHVFMNLFVQDEDTVCKKALIKITKLAKQGRLIAMGNKVSRNLDKEGFSYIKIVHPAARGKIRKTSLYRKHIKKVMGYAV
jgi:hypothetical protein